VTENKKVTLGGFRGGFKKGLLIHTIRLEIYC
jgi:hypothetical protein